MLWAKAEYDIWYLSQVCVATDGLHLYINRTKHFQWVLDRRIALCFPQQPMKTTGPKCEFIRSPSLAVLLAVLFVGHFYESEIFVQLFS